MSDFLTPWTVVHQAPLSMGGEGNGTPLQYSCLANPMDGAWWAAVNGVAKSRIWLSDFTFTFHFHALEKEMASHSSVLAWRIPGMGEPGGLPSLGSHRVGHNWSNLAAAAAANIYSIYKIKILKQFKIQRKTKMNEAVIFDFPKKQRINFNQPTNRC